MKLLITRDSYTVALDLSTGFSCDSIQRWARCKIETLAVSMIFRSKFAPLILLGRVFGWLGDEIKFFIAFQGMDV